MSIPSNADSDVLENIRENPYRDSSTTANTNPVGYVSEKTYSRGGEKQELREKIDNQRYYEVDAAMTSLVVSILSTRDGQLTVRDVNKRDEATQKMLHYIDQLLSDTVNEVLDGVWQNALNNGVVRMQTEDGGFLNTHVADSSAIEQVRKDFNE